MTFRRKDSAFKGCKVTIAPGQPVKWAAQAPRLFLVTGVSGKIDIQARHLVEADDTICRTLPQVLLHPGQEFFVAPHIGERANRHRHHLEARGNFARPFQHIDTDGVSTRLAGQRNTQEVALQAAERKIFVEGKSQLHQIVSGGISAPRGRL